MSASWKGALTFGSFPVNVTFYPAIRSRSSDSFKTLAPNGAPIKQVYVDTDGQPVARDACSKGLEQGKDTYLALTSEQVEAIESGQRSREVEPTGFAPLSTVPLHLAQSLYAVLPDEKIAGSGPSVNALWNGLRSTEAAYLSTITIRTRDSILAVWADEAGLWAALLPFVSEFAQRPAVELTPDAAQAKLVSKVIDGHGVEPFDHESFVSQYATRRLKVIDEALSGAPSTVEAKPAATVDLMSALLASGDEIVKATAKPKRKKATAKA